MKIREVTLSFRTVGQLDAKAINCPADVVAYIRDAFEVRPEQEAVYVLLLDTKHKPKGRHLVTLGTLNESLIHPREVLRPALVAGCYGFILAHNHPSGDPAPSSADIAVTKRINEAAKMIQVEFIDHVIFGDEKDDPNKQGFFSFKDSGLL